MVFVELEVSLLYSTRWHRGVVYREILCVPTKASFVIILQKV